MAKYFGKGDHIPAAQNPLFRKGVSVPMDASGLHSAPLVILIQHMIRGAFGQLLSENIAEQKIIIRLVLSVFQELLEDAAHCSVKRHYQSFSVLGHSYIDHIIIEINVFNSDVH
jgi:hypothetical protein